MASRCSSAVRKPTGILSLVGNVGVPLIPTPAVSPGLRQELALGREALQLVQASIQDVEAPFHNQYTGAEVR